MIDVAKDVLGWVVLTVLAYAWWLVMLLFASLVMLNIWNPTFRVLLRYSAVLTVVTSVAYLVFMLRRRLHKPNY